MVLITIVNGVYKPNYNWGAPHCSSNWLSIRNMDSHSSESLPSNQRIVVSWRFFKETYPKNPTSDFSLFFLQWYNISSKIQDICKYWLSMQVLTVIAMTLDIYVSTDGLGLRWFLPPVFFRTTDIVLLWTQCWLKALLTSSSRDQADSKHVPSSNLT